MKSAKLFLILISLIFVSCANTPYVPTDVYLANEGYAEYLRNNYELAETNFLVALDINPNNPYALLNMGALYQDTGRTVQAIQMYEKVVELNPEEVAVQSNKEEFAGITLVEIVKVNLSSLRVGILDKDSMINPIELEEFVSIDTAIYASASYIDGEQASNSLANSGGPSSGGGPGDGGPGGGTVALVAEALVVETVAVTKRWR